MRAIITLGVDFTEDDATFIRDTVAEDGLTSSDFVDEIGNMVLRGNNLAVLEIELID